VPAVRDRVPTLYVHTCSALTPVVQDNRLCVVPAVWFVVHVRPIVSISCC